MTRDFKSKAIGTIGEKIVANYMSSTGNEVIWNTEEFGFWDLKINGELCQVKTFTPFIKYNCWTIPSKNTGINIDHLFECKNLYIISIPSIYIHSTDGKLFKIPTSSIDKKLIQLQGAINPGIIIKRDHIALEEIYTLTKEEIKSITDNSVSYFTKK